jgi:cytochrome P450
MAARPPVSDWATDWDHLDPAWTTDPYEIWNGLRQQCPVAHTSRYSGVYFPTRYQDVRDIAYDYEHFSSRRVVVREGDYRVNSPPITSDPPDHRPLRMVLIPPFTPKAVAKLEAKARIVCNALIDKFVSSGACDGAVDYAQNIPVLIITHMLGIPAGHGDQFREWITMALQAGVTDEQALKNAEEAIAAYFEMQIKTRREHPGDDLVSFLIAARSPDGGPFSDRQVFGALRLLLVAGIDTTWSAIGSSLWHLATHQEDRARLVAEPELIPTAVEEFLRAYAPVTMAREIHDDRNRRLSDATRANGAAVISGRQPRPRKICRCGQGRDRSQEQSACGIWPGHPSLHRVEPGADGNGGGVAGMAEADSLVQPRYFEAYDMVPGNGARPPQSTDRYRIKPARVPASGAALSVREKG